MRITQWDKSDSGVFDGCLGVERAAHQADDPAGPPMSARKLRAVLSGDGAGSTETWYVPGTGQSPPVLAWYRLLLPDRENLDLGRVDLVVHPACRRRGLGTALLRHVAERAAARGRSRLAGELFRDGAGAAFARKAGARAGVAEDRRRLDVTAIPPGRIAGLRENAARAAAGYSLVRWTGPVPEEHLDGFARVLEAMNDAPGDFEDARWDARRVREQTNARIVEYGKRRYTIAAVHDASGQMAALTELSVDPGCPQWAEQHRTAVARPHRGHRLGLLLKATMLEWLATAEPDLRMIQTGNASPYMIAINEQLGFELFPPGWQVYTITVAEVLGRNPSVFPR